MAMSSTSSKKITLNVKTGIFSFLLALKVKLTLHYFLPPLFVAWGLVKSRKGFDRKYRISCTDFFEDIIQMTIFLSCQDICKNEKGLLPEMQPGRIPPLSPFLSEYSWVP